MIAAHVKAAVMALLETDGGASGDERAAVMAALEGRPHSARVVTFREAAKRTGLNRNTLRAMCRKGLLRGVAGSGKRMLGIAEASLFNFGASAL